MRAKGRIKAGFIRFAWAAAASVSVPFFCHAQPVAIGAGYRFPRPIDVAPGQVITVFVRVPGKSVAAPLTAQPPLPPSLGGFSVVLRQTFPSVPSTVPIQAVEDLQSCSEPAPSQCDVVSMITVQIPFELTPNVPRALMPMNFARLDITYNGVAASSLFLNAVTDRIHVLNVCDVIANRPVGNCGPVVTHPDGSLVDLEHPAQVGETLTMTLVGLGLMSQVVATGAAAPQPAPAVENVRIDFDARPNETPAPPAPASSLAPDTARLRSGSVGIYDVTFTVPSMPAGAPACSTEIRSNLTVSIGRTTSYDGISICVDPASGGK